MKTVRLIMAWMRKKWASAIEGETIEEALAFRQKKKNRFWLYSMLYIDTFNEQDVEGYLNTFSDTRKDYDFEEEREFMEEAFGEFDIKSRSIRM